MLDRIRREPALTFALIEAIVALTAAFGFGLTGEQTAAIMAVVAVLTGVGVRQKVSPYEPDPHGVDA